MMTLSCSACHGTIARDITLDASSPTEIRFEMSMKCPHCKHPNKIKIVTRLEKTISINGRTLEAGVGEPHELAVRSL